MKVSAFCIVFLCVFVLFNQTSFCEEASYAEVFSLKGAPLIQRQGTQKWDVVIEGAEVGERDSIRTGEGEWVELAFDEDKVIRVEPSSQVVVLFDGDERIELIDGEVYATISNLPPGSSFIVKTPVAIAGARGTDWLTRYRDGEAEVEAYDQTPFVRNMDRDGRFSDVETPVRPGFSTKVKRYEKPSQPDRMPDNKIQKWNGLKGQMKPRLNEAKFKNRKTGKPLGGDKAFKKPVQQPTGKPQPGNGKKPDSVNKNKASNAEQRPQRKTKDFSINKLIPRSKPAASKPKQPDRSPVHKKRAQ
jgi:hypothetical protein